MWSDGYNRRIPENFKFPTSTLLEGWNLWLDGDPSRKHPPYRDLTPEDFGPVGTSTQRKLLCDWKAVFGYMEKHYLRKHPASSFSHLKPARITEMYEECKECIPRAEVSSSTTQRHLRPEHLKVSTMVKYLRKISHDDDGAARRRRKRSEPPVAGTDGPGTVT